MPDARKIWKTLNEGVIGYIFYIILGIVAAVAVTNILGLALDTSIPLVAVVSGSMDHGRNEDGFPCGKLVSGYEESFDAWWDLCEETYDELDITKEQFSHFPFRDGLKKGDIVVLQNDGDFQIGDIIVYNRVEEEYPVPIIHRLVIINADGTFQTKGDHNPPSVVSPAGQNIDYEKSIDISQVRGKAILVVPYLGYLRVLLPIS